MNSCYRWSAVLVAAAACTAGAATVVLPNGNRVEGTDVRARPNGDVILTTPQGQRTFPRGQYARAEADKPPAYDRAASLMSQGDYDQAIRLLRGIVEDYRYLTWDNNARIAIARIHLTQGQPDAAVAVFDELFEADPSYREDSQIAWGYRSALLEAGAYDKLEGELDAVIAEGTREDAARAQVLRGDARMKQGLVKQAVMDYLRSAILFESATAVHPEALWKAGQGLEQLRDPRARDMYRKLVEDYPSSPQAREARAKL